jgi:hypothetical protein
MGLDAEQRDYGVLQAPPTMAHILVVRVVGGHTGVQIALRRAVARVIHRVRRAVQRHAALRVGHAQQPRKIVVFTVFGRVRLVRRLSASYPSPNEPVP